MSLDVHLQAEHCSHCKRGDEVFWRNITNNLNEMADAAGLYKPLWRPEEMEPPVEKAAALVPFLEAGIQRLKADPEKFKTFNPKNGWGSYEGLIDFCQAYLIACRENPDAAVRVSR